MKYTDPSGHAAVSGSGISPLTKLIEEEFGTGGWDEYYTIGEFSHAVRSGLNYAVSETDDSHTQRHLAADRATDRLVGPGGDYWDFTKLSIFGWLYGETWTAAAAAAEDMSTSQMMMTRALYAPGPLSNGPNWTYEGEEYKFSFPRDPAERIKSGIKPWNGPRLSNEVGPLTGSGWVAKGPNPASGKGGYDNSDLQSGLRVHPADSGHFSHWDYVDKTANMRYRVYPNGTGGGWMVPKQ